MSGVKRGVKNDIFLVGSRVRIWRTGQHTPTKNSQEYPPGIKLKVFCYTEPESGIRGGGVGGGGWGILKVEDHLFFKLIAVL